METHVGMWREAILAAVGLLLISACDLAKDDPCPSGPAIAEADFFPLEEGNTWTYRYHHYLSARIFPPIEDTYAGTVKLEVLSVTCVNGYRRVTWREQLQVTRRRLTQLQNLVDTSFTQISDARTLYLEEDPEGKTSHPWLSGQLVRYHPGSGDTVRLTVSGEVRSLGSHLCFAPTEVSLVRGVGLQRMGYFCADPSVAVEEGGGRSLIQADVKPRSK